MRNKQYMPCIGRKYRLIPKLYRPFSILLGIDFCNIHLNNKNMLKIFKQLIRFFYKSRWGYNISEAFTNINNNNIIIEGSIISLCARTQKAALKKLFLKLNYSFIDYKILKRRQYLLNLTFLFLNINNKEVPELFLDINCKCEDAFNIFIVVNGYFLIDFYNILYFYEIFIKSKPKLKFYKILISNLCEELFTNYYNLFLNKLEFLQFNEIILIKK